MEVLQFYFNSVCSYIKILIKKYLNFQFQPTCKEPGSHHFNPQKKKAEQIENQWLFLATSQNWGQRINHHPES